MRWMLDARLPTGVGGLPDDWSMTDHIRGGFDRWVKLEIRVNRDKGEVFGMYDFGEGWQTTKVFPVTKKVLDAIDSVMVFADYRSPDEFRGMRVRKLKVTATIR